MPESEDKPPTLASLRARRGKLRSRNRPSSDLPGSDLQEQAGLFSALDERFSSPDSSAIEDESNHTEPPLTSATILHKPIPTTLIAPDRRIWTVRALVLNIRKHVETTYTDLWVEGEISNCRRTPSEHIYFTLKDGEAQFPVVLFRRQASLLRFRPTDGLAVLVRGRVSIYESRGQLQLIAETMEPRGAGALQLAFEQLKTRLLAEGLFDAERKRDLPAFPKCLGIITSPTGAVIRDIMTVVRRRHARLNLLVYPATMQGPSAPASVIAGIRWFNANPSLVDVIVLARGGGSLEDLAGFNDEELAREIVASDLAIVSAIGHETDFTIADFAADLRAPTPSAAAELITAAQHRIEERVAALGARVHRAGSFHLMQARQSYVRLSAESVLSRVRDDISRRHQHIDELSFRMNASARHRLRVGAQQLAHIDQRLHNQDVISRIATVHRRLQAVDYRLRSAAAKILVKRQARLNRASAGMRALSPLAVLSRGYSLIYAADGKLLRSAADTAPGEIIRARLADGTLEAEVKQTNIDEAKDMETKHS